MHLIAFAWANPVGASVCAVSDAFRLLPLVMFPRCVPHGRAWRCVLSRHFRRTVPNPSRSVWGAFGTAFMMRSGSHRPGRIAFQWPSSLRCRSDAPKKARSTCTCTRSSRPATSRSQRSRRPSPCGFVAPDHALRVDAVRNRPRGWSTFTLALTPSYRSAQIRAAALWLQFAQRS